MIGDLYNAKGVVVGQAAALFAPVDTPLPNLNAIGKTNLADTSFTDPFSLTPWTAWTVNGAVAPVTAFTLSYGGSTTASLTVAALTAAAIQTALAALPSVGAGNVVVGGTAATGWTVAFDDAIAGNSSLTVTPTGGTATVAGALWTPCGATDQGWSFGSAKTTADTTIEEQSPPVGRQITAQSVTVEAALSEDVTKTLALAHNGLITTTAQATGVPGTDEINLTDNVLTYALALIMQQFNGNPRVVYAPEWTQLANVSTAMRRAAAKRMYAVSFGTICKVSQIRIINFKLPGL